MPVIGQSPSTQLNEAQGRPAGAVHSLDPATPRLQATLWIAKARTDKFRLQFEDIGKMVAE